MKRLYCYTAAITGCIMGQNVSAQKVDIMVVPAIAAPENIAAAANGIIIIKRDTPVVLMATKEITTADVRAGTQFKLRLDEALIAGGKIVAPIGTWATGEVTSAEESGGLGRSGKMQTRLLYLEIGSVRVPLQGDMAIKGQGAGSAGAAVLFAGVAGLFHRGNNAKIKAGELVHGFVAEDTAISGNISAPVMPSGNK